VSGNVTISLAASDNVGVALLACYVNGTLLSLSNDVDSLGCRWNTRKLPNGLYSVEGRAQDAAGNLSTSAISVRIGADSTDDSSTPNPGKGNKK
jgi:hypothetical protein